MRNDPASNFHPPSPSLCGRWLLALLLCLLPAAARAGLINSRGLWDFDNTLSSYWSCFPPVTADGLVLGTD